MIYEVNNYRDFGFYVTRYAENPEERDIVLREGGYLLKNGNWNNGTAPHDPKISGYYNSYRFAVQTLKSKCGNVKVIRG